MTKICTKCKIEKEITEFSKCKKIKSGYRGSCKKCDSEYSKNFYKNNTSLKDKDILKIRENKKRYYNNNKDKICNKSKIYYEENKFSCKESQKKWALENKEYRSLYKKKYREDNKETINKWHIEKWNNDSLYRLSFSIRNSIRESFISKKFNKRLKTSDILGLSFEEFKLYLESKFEPWMNWDNRGLYNGEFNYGWDIDHKIPISSAKTEEEVIKLNHYTNLQPLCSKVNRDIKKDKFNYENMSI